MLRAIWVPCTTKFPNIVVVELTPLPVTSMASFNDAVYVFSDAVAVLTDDVCVFKLAVVELTLALNELCEPLLTSNASILLFAADADVANELPLLTKLEVIVFKLAVVELTLAVNVLTEPEVFSNWVILVKTADAELAKEDADITKLPLIILRVAIEVLALAVNVFNEVVTALTELLNVLTLALNEFNAEIFVDAPQLADAASIEFNLLLAEDVKALNDAVIERIEPVNASIKSTLLSWLEVDTNKLWVAASNEFILPSSIEVLTNKANKSVVTLPDFVSNEVNLFSIEPVFVFNEAVTKLRDAVVLFTDDVCALWANLILPLAASNDANLGSTIEDV